MFALTAQFPWATDIDTSEAGAPWAPGFVADASMAATSSELLTKRLRNQLLVESTRRKPEQVVSWLCAMQAQDFSAAKWAVASRAPGVQDGDVEQAFNDGLILRTHVLRPTWHFVTPQDIRWLLALSAPRIHAANDYYYRQSDLDAKTFAKSCAMIHRVLEGGKTMTRAELAVYLKRAKIPADGLKLAYVMMHAELEGVITSGPRRAKQFTYALMDERVPKGKTLDRDEALAELAKRYFTSHGPATARDFAWWSGLTIKDAQRAAESAGTLEFESIGGVVHWSAKDSNAAAFKSSCGLLLPNYDEYSDRLQGPRAFRRREPRRQHRRAQQRRLRQSPGDRRMPLRQLVADGEGDLGVDRSRTVQEAHARANQGRDQRVRLLRGVPRTQAHPGHRLGHSGTVAQTRLAVG